MILELIKFFLFPFTFLLFVACRKSLPNSDTSQCNPVCSFHKFILSTSDLQNYYTRRKIIVWVFFPSNFLVRSKGLNRNILNCTIFSYKKNQFPNFSTCDPSDVPKWNNSQAQNFAWEFVRNNCSHLSYSEPTAIISQLIGLQKFQ